MAGEANDTNWSRPKSSFSVDIDGVGTNLSFKEVSGLDPDTQAAGHRGAKNKDFSTIEMPGVHTSGTITLKRGVLEKAKAFFAWADAVKRDASRRSNVRIKLLDENGNPTMAWTLHNAWPTKYDGPGLNATGNDVAVEAIELTYEGISLEK